MSNLKFPRDPDAIHSGLGRIAHRTISEKTRTRGGEFLKGHVGLARPAGSIRFRQAEDAFGDVAEDQLRADRGDAGDLDLAEIALDMVLAGVAVAAMRHHRGLAGA